MQQESTEGDLGKRPETSNRKQAVHRKSEFQKSYQWILSHATIAIHNYYPEE